MNRAFEELAELVGRALAQRWLESRTAKKKTTDNVVAQNAPEVIAEPSTGAPDAEATSASST